MQVPELKVTVPQEVLQQLDKHIVQVLLILVVPAHHQAGVHLHTAVLLQEVQVLVTTVLLQEAIALLLPAEVLQVAALQAVAPEAVQVAALAEVQVTEGKKLDNIRNEYKQPLKYRNHEKISIYNQYFADRL